MEALGVAAPVHDERRGYEIYKRAGTECFKRALGSEAAFPLQRKSARASDAMFPGSGRYPALTLANTAWRAF